MIDVDYVRNFRQTILGDFSKHQSERVADFESRLKPGISVEERNEKVNAFKRRVKVQFLTEKFLSMFQMLMLSNPGEYLKTTYLIEVFNVEEKTLRQILSKVRRNALTKGLVLGNKPRQGYRLGQLVDIPSESVKAMLRALTNTGSSLRIIRSTKDGQRDLGRGFKKIVDICEAYAKDVIAPLTLMEEELNGLPEYAEIREHIGRTLKILDDINSGHSEKKSNI